MNFEKMLYEYENGECSTSDLLLQLNEIKDQPMKLNLSEGQKGLWMLYKMYPNMYAYNIPICFSTKNKINIKKFESAFHFVLNIQPILTVTIKDDGGIPYQVFNNPDIFKVNYEDISNLDNDSVIPYLKKKVQKPFVLNKNQLIRIDILSHSKNKHYILITIHHIIFDGSSLLPFINTLLDTYLDLIKGDIPHSLPSKSSYADFIEWEHNMLLSENGQACSRYWKQQLSGTLPVLELPTDYPRTLAQNFNGEVYTSTLSKEISDQIKINAKSINISNSVFFIAIFQMLLYRYTDQEDIIVGMPTMMRPKEDFDNVIGYFINMLPIRSQMKGTMAFKNYASKLQKTVFDALDHCEYPFSKQVQDLNLQNRTANSPVFQVAYNYQSFLEPNSYQKIEKKYQSTLSLEFAKGLYQEGEYELILDVIQENGFNLNFKYNPDLYEHSTIVRMANHFLNLIIEVIKNPDISLDESNLLSADESRIILSKWNETQQQYPKEKCVYDLFEEQVSINPNSIAVIYEDTSLTYKELDEKSTILAIYLQHKGIGANDIVGICVERSLDMIVGLLGIMKAGGAYVPLDPYYPINRLSYMINDCNCNIMLTQSALSDKLSSIVNSVEMIILDTDWNIIEKHYENQNNLMKSKMNPKNLAYLIYTSGSTSKPKGVMISQQALTNFLISMKNKLHMHSQDKMLAVTTYCFDIAGLELFLPLIVGAQCYICNSDKIKNVEMLKQEIKRISPTIMQATPITWNMLFQVGWENLEDVKILCGGEPLTDKLKQSFVDTSDEVWNMYGPTETTIWSTMQQIKKEEDVNIGKPIANTQIYILGKNLKPMPIGIPGELCIAGDGVAVGYYNRPELTSEKFINNSFNSKSKLYRTGDLARWLANGNIELLGRIDNQVKIRGFRIELGEIENNLNSYHDIENSIVVVKEQESVKKLVAYYIGKKGNGKKGKINIQKNINIRDLRTYLKLQLPDYMIPNKFIELDELPLMPNGKVDRIKLVNDKEFILFTNETKTIKTNIESEVVKIFKTVLNSDDINLNDGFFNIGGNSLLAIAVVEKINKMFDCDVSVTSLFKHSNIKDFSAYIEKIILQNTPTNFNAKDELKDSESYNQNSTFKQETKKMYPDYYKDSIAIVGVACQFPDAKNHYEFWENLKTGKESIKFIPEEDLRTFGVKEEIIKNPHFVPQHSVISNKEMFDPKFFNISPRDAEFMDPQLRLLLMNSWKAIEDAGYKAKDIPNTSVFMSASNNFYQALLPDLVLNTTKTRIVKNTDEYVAWILAQGGSIPTMISHKLGLKGASMYVHSNCSSSLVGLHLAYQSLLSKDANYALVGASSIFPATSLGYFHQPGLNFSSDGRCKAFDESADGMVGGEGVTVVLLKSALDAIKDGDNIYALVRGVGVNNDGSEKVGFYAPSVQGQTAVIQKVLDQTKINPETINYIEAHGTGTKLGDPIEFKALTDAYKPYTNKKQFCGIGSVKTNIGHLDAASGLAGFIKVALSLYHNEIPASLNFKTPNTDIDFENSPFYVVDKHRKFEESCIPCRAAISSFGLGGTNVHAILEKYTDLKKANNNKIENNHSQHLVILSAKNNERLKDYAQSILDFLPKYEENYSNLLELAYTLQVGRQSMDCRVIFIVNDISDLREKLAEYVLDNNNIQNCYIGNIKQFKNEGIKMFEYDDDNNEMLTIWMQRGDLRKIAQLWVKGVHINWEHLYSSHKPSRVSLPTYPFEEKRYWINEQPIEDKCITVKQSTRKDNKSIMKTLGSNLSLEASKLLKKRMNSNDINHVIAQYNHINSDMEEILSKLLLSQLIELGFFKENNTLANMEFKFGIKNIYSKWLTESIRVLMQKKYLSYDGKQYYLTNINDFDLHHTWKEWEQKKNIWMNNVEMRSKVILADTMIRSIPKIITNQILATNVMFPDSSMKLVEGIYKDNLISNYFNEVLADTAIAYIQERLKQDTNVKIRIFEIGAGTGGTSEMMFKKLKPYYNNIKEYCYTDVSKAFLIHAEKQYGMNNLNLNYRIFNAESSTSIQEIETGSYDIVIATNVLHATKNISHTICNVKELLKDKGLLLLNEINENSLLMHLTFGLLEGWWLYDDVSLRIPGGPGITSDIWTKVLNNEGFYSILFPAHEAEEFGLQIIAAESNGIIQQSHSNKFANSRNEMKSSFPGHGNNVSYSVAKQSNVLEGNKSIQNIKGYIKQSIIEKLSKSLKLDVNEIKNDESFADYGLDSLIGVNLVNLLNQKFSIELEVTCLFDYPSVNELTNYIFSNFQSVTEEFLIQNKGDFNNQSSQVISKEDNITIVGEKTTQQPNDEQSKQNGPIAIIGMSGRFPQADSVNELWEHLSKGNDLIERVTRWDLSKYHSKNNTYCNHGGFLKDISKFDPLFFNISGLEATYMEPQQRIFLEESWNALEDAGYAGNAIKEQQCGVYVGCTAGDYLQLTDNNYPAQAFWGNMSSVVPSRISYYLNLKGPAMAVDTACSSSLVAMHLACQSLWAGEIDMALAGGIFIQCTPRLYIAASRAGMLSPTGKCHAFDDQADGFVPGEGAGVLVLKRLKDALAAGDNIHGIIRGSGINQDGTTNGITAPSSNSQESLEKYVYNTFNINPEKIQMVEAHGTGTKLGDPIEFKALSSAFETYTNKKEFCALGSIKTNIGHTQLAAGAIGIIKILLAMKNKKIPPSLHYKIGNSNIKFTESPFYVNTSLKNWDIGPNSKRSAAISAFGASGTNAHMVIEEAPIFEQEHSEKFGYLFTLSARTPEQLRKQAKQLIDYCEQEPNLDCDDMSYTLLLGRKHFNHRLACVVRDKNEFIVLLKEWLQNRKSIHIFVSELCDNDYYEESVSKQSSCQSIYNCITANNEAEYLDHLSAVANLYVQGCELEFQNLFQAEKYLRISLPTYPFADEKYWIPNSEWTAKNNRVSAYIHPLIQRNTSNSIELSFSSTFTGDEFFLKDHVVKGTSILPGSAYLEMARTAFEQLNKDSKESNTVICLRNIVWLLPISVGEKSIEVYTKLIPNENEAMSFEICSDIKGADSAIHCQGEVLLSMIVETPVLDLPNLQSKCEYINITTNKFYEGYQSMGINYGPSFKGINSIYIGKNQVLAKILLPDVIYNTLNQYILHPTLVDCALQCMGLLRESVGLMQSEDIISNQPNLLFAVQEIQIIGKCTSVMWAWIRYSNDNLQKNKILKIDVDLCNEQGKVCVKMRKISTRALEEENNFGQEEKSKLSDKPLTMVPVWDPVRIEKANKIPSTDDRIVIIGGTKEIQDSILQRYPSANILRLEPQNEIVDIEQILKIYGYIDHLIWVAPYRPLHSLADDVVIDEQYQGAIQIFRIGKALLDLGYSIRNFGWTVITIQSQPIYKNDIVNPTHASIHGIVGSVAKEYPNWKIRMIDLDVDYLWPLDDIFTIPADPDGNTLVFRDGQWFKQQLIPVNQPKMENTTYRRGGVYVVIGGAGGVGEAWSEYMIHTYNAQIIWIGRRQKNDIIQSKIKRLSDLGLAPYYIVADATDYHSLQKAYEEIKQKFAHINGVIHAALVFSGSSLEKMSEEQFCDVLSAKVDVSVRLTQVFKNEPLDFVMFFSSLNSYFRAIGQSNYAAACTFKDAFAHQLSQELACSVKVINLGYCFNNIEDKGEKSHTIINKIRFIEPNEIMDALEFLLASEIGQMALIKFSKELNTRGIKIGNNFMTIYPDEIISSIKNMSKHISNSKVQEDQLNGIKEQMQELNDLLI
ncbi:amino acid adenylation domain-containing protein [Clostridium tagluense]|uniref:non-ribosomal peptide synthetase n=1 Tax=Clostridium tagluense TaxID=360422 RepID=UPI001CF51365|nr:non-ribosomal peptide synthetase [Clostridium tagluense]MCB2312713.1 amino acid adenylation domain-containing protein [Clostridium tagluense]MCB2317480.1 amino acid adenylation domain-containing protein [Clostridium tagluense]MCB2322289.1 amino acid adenylation domain-containing protein [Clostridium tagluense]MCB2327293.1 amino acid adenylation domain-containing protein [Clostridium tagluense]MCB2331981.1 amino acid adenylation domain-containing protein [Clostridium tagluense]